MVAAQILRNPSPRGHRDKLAEAFPHEVQIAGVDAARFARRLVRVDIPNSRPPSSGRQYNPAGRSNTIGSRSGARSGCGWVTATWCLTPPAGIRSPASAPTAARSGPPVSTTSGVVTGSAVVRTLPPRRRTGQEAGCIRPERGQSPPSSQLQTLGEPSGQDAPRPRAAPPARAPAAAQPAAALVPAGGSCAHASAALSQDSLLPGGLVYPASPIHTGAWLAIPDSVGPSLLV